MLTEQQFARASAELRAQLRARLETSRPLALELAQRLPGAAFEDDLRGTQIIAHFRAQDCPIRIALEWGSATIQVTIPGILGEFCLSSVAGSDAELTVLEEGWTELERPVFFSKQCVFQSGGAYQELERWLALPVPLSERWVEYCDRSEIEYVALENEALELYLNDEQRSAPRLLELLPLLTSTAQALARPLASDLRSYARRHECQHCRCVVYVKRGVTRCSRCGAPSVTAESAGRLP